MTGIIVKKYFWPWEKNILECTKRVKGLYISNMATLCFFCKTQWKILTFTRINFVQQYPLQPAAFLANFMSDSFFCQKRCFMGFYSCPKGPLGLLMVKWPEFSISIVHVVRYTMISMCLMPTCILLGYAKSRKAKIMLRALKNEQNCASGNVIKTPNEIW